MRWIWLGVMLGGCAPPASWTIDVRHLADEASPDGLFMADLVLGGETVRRVSIPFDSDELVVTIDEAFIRTVEYGVVAFADMDGDRTCTLPPPDLGWSFVWVSFTDEGFAWAPEVELGNTIDGCAWFGLETVEPENFVVEPD